MESVDNDFAFNIIMLLDEIISRLQIAIPHISREGIDRFA